MIVNDRYVVVLKAGSWGEVGRELLEISPRGDGTGLTVELAKQEEEFLLVVGGFESPGQALAIMILEAGQIPRKINHSYDTETCTFRT